MTDLHARFRALDRLPAPDLRDEIDRRARLQVAAVPLRQATPLDVAHQPAIASPARRHGGVGVAVVAAMLLLGGLAVAGGLLTPSPSPIASPTRSPAPSIWAAPSVSLTGSMVSARCAHAGVRLDDGLVLIVGGWGEGGAAVMTPELYDPGTGAFREVGGRTSAAEAMSATLLADGRVLVAGGMTRSTTGSPCTSMDSVVAPGQETADAFLFDPSTGSVEQTGPMGVPRLGHAAIRLDDGRVLVAGGQGMREDGTFGALRSAEIYDPASGTFEPTGAMANPRGWSRVWGGGVYGPVAVATGDGRVIVAGGLTDLDTPDVYDPATGTFAAFRADPTMQVESLSYAVQTCPCAETIDLRTGAIQLVGHGPRRHVQMARVVLIGDLLVVVDQDHISVDDIRTEFPGVLRGDPDHTLRSLIGTDTNSLPSVTALDANHVLIAGGTAGSSPITGAQILTMAPRARRELP